MKPQVERRQGKPDQGGDGLEAPKVWDDLLGLEPLEAVT